MVVHMITPNEKIYWKSICKDGVEIASINLNLVGSETQLITYSNEDVENEENFLFNGFYYIGAQNTVCLNMKIDLNPNDFDKILKRIKKLLVFS